MCTQTYTYIQIQCYLLSTRTVLSNTIYLELLLLTSWQCNFSLSMESNQPHTGSFVICIDITLFIPRLFFFFSFNQSLKKQLFLNLKTILLHRPIGHLSGLETELYHSSSTKQSTILRISPRLAIIFSSYYFPHVTLSHTPWCLKKMLYWPIILHRV